MNSLWSRSLVFIAALGLLSACDEMLPKAEEDAPAVVAPSVKTPAATAPVKKKKPVPPPVVIDFGGSGSGGGGWSG